MQDKYKLAVELYEQGKSIKNIAKEIHANAKLISNYLKENNIDIRGKSSTTKIYTNTEINNILNLYVSGKSIREINKLTKINRYDISYILKNNKIKIKMKEEFNENYFEKINTSEKAYWLGMMYADGNIYYNIKENKYHINLTLKISDEKHIKNFCKCIDYNGKIYYKTVRKKKYVSFNKESKTMFNDLKNKGCIERKSNILKFPLSNILPIQFHKDFIRGYFDGDGCISIDRSKTPSILFNVVGTNEFLNSIKNILILNNFNIKSNINKCTKTKLTKHSLYSFNVKGNITALNIFNWLYDNTNLYLERKHNKYIIFKNHLAYCRLNSIPLKSLDY